MRDDEDNNNNIDPQKEPKATMTTPWDRLTDDTYKSWLLEAMTVEEYNASTVRDRRGLLSDFEQQQQQQHTHVSSDEQSAAILASLSGIDKKLDDMATVSEAMSKAGIDFARSLLQELNLNYTVCPVNETRDGALDVYPWGEKESEEQGQPGCKAMLEKEVLPFEVDEDMPLGFFDVRNRALSELKGGKYKSNGFSDLALGHASSIEHAMQHNKDLVLCYADALVELKTDKSELKQGQLLLQLVSGSVLSNKKKGVVVLGTDCATKWRLLHFTDHNQISVQPYRHGKKCLEDFKKLVETGKERSKLVSPLLQSIPEDAQLRLEEFGFVDTESDKAIDREDYLNKVANALGSVFRESEAPIVPQWARATSSPEYYM